MLSILTGKCWSHLASVSRTEGQFVQKADGRERQFYIRRAKYNSN